MRITVHNDAGHLIGQGKPGEPIENKTGKYQLVSFIRIHRPGDLPIKATCGKVGSEADITMTQRGLEPGDYISFDEIKIAVD